MSSMSRTAANLFHALQKPANVQAAVKMKPGQILAGKVMKLYPDQKASIQFGGRNIVAQLEAPLTANGKYWFQVATVGEVIRLKVLSSRTTAEQSSQGIAALLDELGIKNTKDRTALLNQLVTKKIPFQKETLLQAFQLMEEQMDKQAARSTIVEMISRKLPMTVSVLQALQAKKAEGFGNLLADVQNKLTGLQLPSEMREALSIRLNGFTYQKNTPLFQLLQMFIDDEAGKGNSDIYQLLKKAGIVTDSGSFTDLQKSLKQAQTPLGQSEVLPSLQKASPEVVKELQQLQRMQLPLSAKFMEQLSSLTELSERKINGDLLPSGQQRMEVLRTQLSRSDFFSMLSTQLPKRYVNALQELTLGTPSPQDIDAVKQVIDRQLPSGSVNLLAHLLSDSSEGQGLLLSDPKQYFLRKVEQVLLFSGLNHENNLSKDQLAALPIKEQTLKSIVLQAISESGNGGNEKLNSLLHYLNGVQLTHHQETVNTVQFHLMLPGDHIGVKNDIQIDFEGNKDEEGKINPDFCHVVFYLDLEKMKETVIDMQIQKRMVSITVFNEHQKLESLFPLFKPALQQGLEQLDYHLTSVRWKPYGKFENGSPVLSGQNECNQNKGVDYRI
ncbi:hypothetical protein [Virgibacillus senegalensis]|uniref:hypothetical protein n=1 Tax=Virgibacillus senegalensis TaxID=1499679 RepID=UPI00069DAE23|nr:hypothetical protein [Virgibacillus senegalensis]